MAGYAWPDGTKGHSIPWATELTRRTGAQAARQRAENAARAQQAANQAKQTATGHTPTGAPGKGVPRPLTPVPGGVVAPPSGMPGVTPQPFDPALAEQQLVGNRNIALANGEAAYQTGNLGFDYGYNPDGTVNVANPYSRAALYQLGYTNSKRGTTNSMAAQGQLWSGAYGHQQDLNDQAYARGEAGNRLAYQRALHGVQSGKLSTYANAGTGIGNADFSSLLKATYPGG
jgi:hypothetical protein